jgi:hypothetical protein
MTYLELQGGLSRPSSKSNFHIVSNSGEPSSSAHLPLSSGDVIRRTHVRGTSRLGSYAGTETQLADPLYAPLITSRGVALSIFSKVALIVFFTFTSTYHHTSSPPQKLVDQQSLSSPNPDNVRYYNGYSDHPV